MFYKCFERGDEMKRMVICFCLVVLIIVGSASMSYSQISFTFTPLHTSRSDTLGSEIILDASVTNTSVSSLTLMFIRSMNALPIGWESSLCLDVCYPPTLDTIATTAAYGTTPLAPNETRPFSVHVFPMINHGTGIVRIRTVNTRNAADSIGVIFSATSRTTSVTALQGTPFEFRLHQNYPNPFNPTSIIRFSLDQSGPTSLRVYNLLGEEITTLVNEDLSAGSYSTAFHAFGLVSGVYYYRLVSGKQVTTKALILLR